MKILLSAFACNPERGSESSVGWNLAKSLSKYNEVYVLTREYNRTFIEKELSENCLDNVKFIYYDLPEKYGWFFWRNAYTSYLYYIIWQYSVYKKLSKSKEYKEYDFIQHTTYASYKNPGFLWLLDSKFVLGPVGGGQVIPKGFVDCYKENLLKEFIRKLVNNIMIKSSYLKNAYNNSNIIFAANEETEKLVEKIKTKKNLMLIRMLETGIQESKINLIDRNNNDNDKVTLMWAGNSNYIKALIIFIKALDKVKCLDKIQVKLVGDIDKDKYEQIVKTYSLSDVIEFTGSVPYKEMNNLYKQSDIFVFTSLRDTSGNVVLEAMANSLPIITLNHQGVKDIVSSDCGIKIEPINTQYVVDELAKSIDMLVGNKELRCEMGKKSYYRIKSKYLWEEKAKEMTGIYNLVAKGDLYESIND